MFAGGYSEVLAGKLAKLKRRDMSQFERVIAKIDQILQDSVPHYKSLGRDLAGSYRVHIGHFVLVFRIDNVTNTIRFDDNDHHDKIYQR